MSGYELAVALGLEGEVNEDLLWIARKAQDALKSKPIPVAGWPALEYYAALAAAAKVRFWPHDWSTRHPERQRTHRYLSPAKERLFPSHYYPRAPTGRRWRRRRR